MKKTLLFFLFILFCSSLQAKIAPQSLNQRVSEGQIIALGKVVATESYWNQSHTNIYTMHTIDVQGYWKGQSAITQLGIVSLGGTIGYERQVTMPSISLDLNQEGIFILSPANEDEMNAAYPNNGTFMQVKATASIQGAFIRTYNNWSDVARPEQPWTTTELFQQLNRLCGNECISPKTNNVVTLVDLIEPIRSNKTAAVTSVADGNNITTSTFSSGTAEDPALEMIINGSGFGTTAGTIQFRDADQGGAVAFTFPGSSSGFYSRYGAPSDILSWTNTQIRIKIPRSAGTGVMEVFNASNVSQGTASITIDWALISAFSTFNGFAQSTRQKIKLADLNGSGGYTFRMSTAGSADFFNDAGAKDAFRRALSTWRCGTSVNFDLDLDNGTSTGFASDGESIVIYDNSLPSGVLGRATTRTTASSTGACNMHDTYWRVAEVDVQFPTAPGALAWNFNETGTTSAQFSFQEVALHELGHGHGMGHVIDNNKVMHFSTSNGSNVIALSASDIAAGSYKMAFSTTTNCLPSPAPMTIIANPCVPLPMYLIAFDAAIDGSGNHITWRTELETSIDSYELQYSLDAAHFKNLHEVNAQGGIAFNDYSYLHDRPLSNATYYRLKIKDMDGGEYYSRIILLKRNDLTSNYIYPNPAQNVLNIKMLSYKAQEVRYVLTDISGQTIQQGRMALNNEVAQLPIESLASGSYLITIITHSDKTTYPFTKN